MKTSLFKIVSIVLAITLFYSQINTSSANPEFSATPQISENEFVLNETEVTNAFSGLDKLDAYLELNKEATYLDIQHNYPDLLNDISASASIPQNREGGHDLFIPAFWWGCLLNIPGVIIVLLLTDNDHHQVKQSLFGCLVSSIIFGGGLLFKF